jgi:hypothetical protein
MMKKDDKILGIFALIPALLALILIIAEGITECEFLINSVSSRLFTAIMFSLSAVFLFIPIIKNLIKKDKTKKTSDYIFSLLRILILVYIVFDCINSYKEHKYHEFTSPDGKHTVVAEEWTSDISDEYIHGCVMFYVRENKFFISQKDLSFNYNGYLPISSNGYTVEWNENNAIFTLQNGNNENETIEIEC